MALGWARRAWWGVGSQVSSGAACDMGDSGLVTVGAIVECAGTARRHPVGE